MINLRVLRDLLVIILLVVLILYLAGVFDDDLECILR